MAFTRKYLPHARLKYFTFFASNGHPTVDPDTSYEENFVPSMAYEVEKIRIHLSAEHVSIVDFMATLSHHIDSAYNQRIISKAMLGVDDYEYRFDPTLRLHPNDEIYFSLIISAVNTYGLEISGWAITQPPGGY